MMPTLHILANSQDLPAACQLCGLDDAILLIGDTTYSACSKSELWQQYRFYLLTTDLEQRGLTARIPAQFNCINDDQWVELLTHYTKTVTWP